MAHAVMVQMLQHPNWKKYLNILLCKVANKDAAIKKVLNVLAASQIIPLAQKDLLRPQIRDFFRANYGDRLFFADSNLHRKWKK